MKNCIVTYIIFYKDIIIYNTYWILVYKLYINKNNLFFQQRFKNMCKNIINESKHEEELLRLALTKINEIRTIRNEHRIQVSLLILFLNMQLNLFDL